MALPLAGKLGIVIKMLRIGQNRLAVLQKQKPFLTGRHCPRKRLHGCERRPQPACHVASIDRRRHHQGFVLVGSVARIATDFIEEALRRVTWVLAYGRPDDGAERQMVLMNVEEIKRVARRLATSGRQCLVGSDVRQMQRVAEQFVRHCWKKPEVAVAYPFQLSAFAAQVDKRGINSGFLPQPFNRKSGCSQDGGILSRCLRDALFTMMKNVYVA